MDAYQCDRCFKFFSRNGLQKPEETVFNTARCSYRWVKIKYGVGTDISFLDLCPSCRKAFKYWFENPYIDKVLEKEGEVND